MKEKVTLNNGVRMPRLGYGVWQVEDPAELDNGVKTAIRTGYISIDTAYIYGNEEGVGKAIRESGVPREELFVTSKLWNGHQREGRETILKAFEVTRKNLGLEVLDLYLIHWPQKGKIVEAWKTMIHLLEQGFVRAIGVSNFQIHHLETIMDATGVVPAVNQVELHPWLSQKPLQAFCREKGIQMEAYSPLMTGHLGEAKELLPIAKKYGKTPAQVVLRWDLQNDVVIIPKSVHEHRIRENCDLFDFELSAADMAAIDAMNRDHRFLPNPDNINF
jgi:diketogulonate reductase-like aldo/keto reductase